MRLVYYQPSGLYKPNALILFFFSIFAWSSVMGAFGGWAFTEKSLHHEFSIDFCILYLCVLLTISSRITFIPIIKFKVRNPKIAFKVGLIAASLGWIFFYLIIRYIILRETDSSFLEFVYTRIKDGYPASLRIGHGHAGAYYFTVKGPMAILMWVLELSVLPFMLALMSKWCAAAPFSEKTGSWCRAFRAPYTIHSPSIKEASKKLKQGDPNWLLVIQANKYQQGSPLCLKNVFLLVPEVDGDDCFYLDTRGWLGKLIRSTYKQEEIRPYLKIDYQTARSMINRFGFDTEKKFAGLVQKLTAGGDGEWNDTSK